MSRLGTYIAVCVLVLSWTTASNASTVPPMQKVYEFFAAGDKNRAYPLLVRLVELNSNETDAYLYLGVLERERKNLSPAIEVFEKGLLIDRKHDGLLVELATTYSWDNRLEEAIATYDRLLKNHPNHMGGILGRARVLAWVGRYQEALEVYSAVLKNNPEHLEALRGTAFVHRVRMRYGTAREYYERVLTIDSEDEEALYGIEAIDAAIRWSVEIGIGTVSFQGSTTSVSGNALLTYSWNPELRNYIGYETVVPSGIGLSGGQEPGSQMHGGKIGIVYRFTERFTFDGHYALRYQNENITHLLGIRGSLKLSDHWVTLAGARPELTHEGQLGLLGDLGLQFLPGPRFWAMAQVFAYGNNQSQVSWSAIGTIWWNMFSPVSVRCGGGGGQVNEQPNQSLYSSLIFHFNKRFDLRLHYEYTQILKMLIRRHGASISLVGRF